MHARLIAVLLLPFLLASCVLAPGKFTSTLTINADRSFAFSYSGEVIAIDAGDSLKGLEDLKFSTEDSDKKSVDAEAKQAAKKAAAKAEAEKRNRAIAAALGKEAGYRKVVYLGDGKFMIDYAIKGVLTHGFNWPYNLDAEVIFPFVSIELRQGGVVRVKAPAFANEGSKSVPGLSQAGGMGAPDMASGLDGVFTLDTDAEIVSQNEESGAQTVGGRKRIVWKATPALKQAPTAVLKLAPLAL